MRTKVSDLRLGDCLAEHPLCGSVVKLELRDDSKAHITYVNESDVMHRDPFMDAEIRTLDDWIETLDQEWHALRARLLKMASDIENVCTITDTYTRNGHGIEIHKALALAVDEFHLARDGGTPWPQFLQDLLTRNTERLLYELFQLEEDKIAADAVIAG